MSLVEFVPALALKREPNEIKGMADEKQLRRLHVAKNRPARIPQNLKVGCHHLQVSKLGPTFLICSQNGTEPVSPVNSTELEWERRQLDSSRHTPDLGSFLRK